jgi:hypothetical protein
MDPKCIKMLTETMRCVTDIDLTRCGLTFESFKYIAKLIAKNYAIKSILLKSNGLQDDSARELLAAVNQNKHITRCKLDMNPAASLLIHEIEQACQKNSFKEGTDLISDCKENLRLMSNQTAELILDCSFDPKVREAVS